MSKWQKPTVVLDCDGVLANWVGRFSERARELVAADPSLIEPDRSIRFYTSHDDVPTYLVEGWEGWTRRLYDATWDSVAADKNWFMRLAPINNSKDESWALIELAENTKLYVVTARKDCNGSPMNELTQHWIEEHYNVQVSVIAPGHSEERKVHVIQALRPLAVIDDSPGILTKLEKMPWAGVPVKRLYRYNVGAPGTPVTHVSDFNRLVQTAMEVAGAEA